MYDLLLVGLIGGMLEICWLEVCRRVLKIFFDVRVFLENRMMLLFIRGIFGYGLELIEELRIECGIIWKL